MIELSYSTMNAALHAPHTWMNKMCDMETFTTGYFENGKRLHRLIQDVLSGKTSHPLLDTLPKFDLVEESEFDERLHVRKEINSKYAFHGYVDMISTDRKEFGDIKTGSPWSLGRMSLHPQFALYAWALGGDFRKFYLINTTSNDEEWTPADIRMFSMEITPRHHELANTFVAKALDVIENIEQYVQDEQINKKPGRSPHCFYKDCSFCKK